jgi:hypothetical protein
MKSILVNPIFDPTCRTQCDAQQLSLHVVYIVSGLQDGEGTSANYANETLNCVVQSIKN